MRGHLFKKIMLLALSLVLAVYSKAQQTAQKFIQETRYLLYLPEGYAKDTTQNWPLILFLHGAGERNNDLEKVKTHGPPRLVAEGKQFPFIIVSPQADQGKGWQPDLLKEMLADIKKKYRVDNDRVYLTGLSMGGYGTWSLAEKYPEEFAAIAPICGGGDTAKVWRLAYMPVWCFHGAKDNVVPVDNSQSMITALKRYNPGVQLTIYPEATHDSWTVTYNNDSLYTWFLSHKKFKFKQVPVPERLLQAYAGTYLNGRKDTVRLKIEDGKLIAEPDNNRMELKASSDTSFFLNENSLFHAVFLRDKKGIVRGFMAVGNDRKLYKKLNR